LKRTSFDTGGVFVQEAMLVLSLIVTKGGWFVPYWKIKMIDARATIPPPGG
jgi:hypothetical protein